MPRRTRANPSPGGLKSLDDVVPKKRGRKTTVKIEQSIETVETIINTTTTEASVAVASTQSQSPPPTNTSRSYSPESRSQSPLPNESRSTSPQVVTTATSNDASSDNDVTTPLRESQPITPLTSGKKRSRVVEPATPSVGTPEGKEEVKEQMSNKRARKSLCDSSSKSDKSEREPEEKGSGRRSARKTERQTPTRKSTPTKSQPRGRRQLETQVNPESSSEDDTEKQPSPVRVRSKSTSKSNHVASSRSPRQVQEDTAVEIKHTTQPEHVSAGPSQTSRAAPKLTLPAPSLQPAPQHVSTLPPLKASDIPTDPDERMDFAAKRHGFQPVTFGADFRPFPPRAFPPRAHGNTPRAKSDVVRARLMNRGLIPMQAFSNDEVDEAQSEQKKTAAASSSETLSTSEINSAARRPEDGLLLTDPYLVTVAQAFINQKDQSKPLPTIEEIQEFLATYQSQDIAEKANSQSIVKSSQQSSSSKAIDSDDDMSGEDEELNEPKTPEPAKSSKWRPFTFVASISSIITSPFRSKAAAIAPVEPYIFDQPVASPVTRPKRMPQTERKRIVRDNGKRAAVPRTERPKRTRDYTGTPIQNRAILTPAQLAQIHRDQDDYARKMGHPNADLQSNAREKRRAVSFARDESTSLARAQLETPAKTGEKRGVNGEVKSKPQPWNIVHDLPSSDESDDEINEINSPTPQRSTPSEKDVPRDLGFTSIYRSAGYTNRMSLKQIQEQREERARGNLAIPPPWKDNFEYLKLPGHYNNYTPIDYTPPVDKPMDDEEFERRQRQLEREVLDPWFEWNHNPLNPANRKSAPETSRNLFAQQQQQRKAQEAKRNAEEPAAQSQNSERPNRGRFQVPDDSDDSDDEAEHGSEAAKGSRILEQKQWTQVPPPKPRPGNAQLPQTDLNKSAPADPAQKEAIQHAMQNANRHAPRKPSNLRNMSTLSPLQAEQQERDKQLSKGKGKQYPWSWAEHEFVLDVLQEVKAAMDEAENDRFLPTTPMPYEIWKAVYEKLPKESEALLAGERASDESESRRGTAFTPYFT